MAGSSSGDLSGHSIFWTVWILVAPLCSNQAVIRQACRRTAHEGGDDGNRVRERDVAGCVGRGGGGRQGSGGARHGAGRRVPAGGGGAGPDGRVSLWELSANAGDGLPARGRADRARRRGSRTGGDGAGAAGAGA